MTISRDETAIELRRIADNVRDAVAEAYDKIGFPKEGDVVVYEDGSWAHSTSQMAFRLILEKPIMRANPHRHLLTGDFRDALLQSAGILVVPDPDRFLLKH